MQFTVSLGKESLSDLFRFFEIVTESDFSDDIQRQSLCHERDVHLYILLAKPLSHAFGSKAKVVRLLPFLGTAHHLSTRTVANLLSTGAQ